jgi:MFS family permease
MITKTIGTLFIIIACILMFPVGIAIVGGVFGIVVGVFAAVFGAFAGIIGGIFGAIFGVFGWMFKGLFHWHWPFGFFNCNIFTLAAIVLVIAIIAKSKTNR